MIYYPLTADQQKVIEQVHIGRKFADENLLYFKQTIRAGDLFELDRHPAPSNLFVVLTVDDDNKKVLTYCLNVKDFVSFEDAPPSRAEMFMNATSSFVNRRVSYSNIQYKLNVLFSSSQKRSDYQKHE